jgi:ABC-type nickel/cobalt efflux system permease component RcnA
VLGVIAALGLITGTAMTLAAVATFVAADFYQARQTTQPPALASYREAQAQ